MRCWFASSDFKPNHIKNRIVNLQYPANNPIEDRFDFVQLKSIQGYFISVFDGHGGW